MKWFKISKLILIRLTTQYSISAGGDDLDHQGQFDRDRKSVDESDYFWNMRPASIDMQQGN